MTEPEVHVRSVRRRRSERPLPATPPPPDLRGWLMYAGVAALITGLMLDGFLRHRPQLLLPAVSYATEVRSAISGLADSLQIVVSWDLTLSEPSGKPDSIQSRVAPGRQRALIKTQPSSQLADTVYLALPPRGQTMNGTSCALAVHAAGGPDEESCTPWQY